MWGIVRNLIRPDAPGFYTDYARVALHEHVAFLGDLEEWESIWECQRAAFFMVSDFEAIAKQSRRTRA